MIDMYTLLADIIDRENVNSNITKLEQLAQTFAQTNDNMLSNFNTLDKQSLDPEELSSLIHINQ